MPARFTARPGTLAFDASARSFDADGRLHIARSHISKACVNPYYGSEIPNAAMLGLDSAKVYYLFRSPEELAKGAATFARLPILSKHIPTSADDPQNDYIVGSIGSEVEFLAPYLDADVCIWDNTAIAGIETETVREFSCSYRYVAVMTPGSFEGAHYDGVMTEIQGNHLAIVEAGRAGSDVLAADETLRIPMKKTKLGTALCVVLARSFPKLAADSAFLPGLVGSAVKKNFDKAAVKSKILAMDDDLSDADVDQVMDAMLEASDPEPKTPKGKDEKPGCEAEDEDDETDEEKKKRERKEAKDKAARDKAAMDAEEKEKRDGETKAAMDSFRVELREAEAAKREVLPVVGEVLAQDSAADVYAFALDQMKVDHAGVTGAPALRAIFKAAHVARTATAAPAPHLALDTATIESTFPGFNRVRVQ